MPARRAATGFAAAIQPQRRLHLHDRPGTGGSVAQRPDLLHEQRVAAGDVQCDHQRQWQSDRLVPVRPPLKVAIHVPFGISQAARSTAFQALGAAEGFFLGLCRDSSWTGGTITIFLAGALGFFGSRPVRFWLFAICVSSKTG
ncbi:protein of unknown function [Magnetospirillum gryphiswaldense MSR-1 v2]|uniref:Uncharacterized protein n=1 Tax=Magnetospirillum gryphiswaldense (strain DSM 6361 / JCM 21280 / NBRC 15271 / MSR-1) TaxID=431944 RepID=V6F0G6_MAGGM|nr:protein of unknown function [Magnetospirillum gryphiswaldense MSR-1 v2]